MTSEASHSAVLGQICLCMLRHPILSWLDHAVSELNPFQECDFHRAERARVVGPAKLRPRT